MNAATSALRRRATAYRRALPPVEPAPERHLRLVSDDDNTGGPGGGVFAGWACRDAAHLQGESQPCYPLVRDADCRIRRSSSRRTSRAQFTSGNE